MPLKRWAVSCPSTSQGGVSATELHGKFPRPRCRPLGIIHPERIRKWILGKLDVPRRSPASADGDTAAVTGGHSPRSSLFSLAAGRGREGQGCPLRAPPSAVPTEGPPRQLRTSQRWTPPVTLRQTRRAAGAWGWAVTEAGLWVPRSPSGTGPPRITGLGPGSATHCVASGKSPNTPSLP